MSWPNASNYKVAHTYLWTMYNIVIQYTICVHGCWAEVFEQHSAEETAGRQLGMAYMSARRYRSVVKCVRLCV